MYVHWSEGRAKVRTLVGSVRAAEPVVAAEFTPIRSSQEYHDATRDRSFLRVQSMAHAIRDAEQDYPRESVMYAAKVLCAWGQRS